VVLRGKKEDRENRLPEGGKKGNSVGTSVEGGDDGEAHSQIKRKKKDFTSARVRNGKGRVLVSEDLTDRGGMRGNGFY